MVIVEPRCDYIKDTLRQKLLYSHFFFIFFLKKKLIQINSLKLQRKYLKKNYTLSMEDYVHSKNKSQLSQ